MINLMFCGNRKMVDGLVIALLSISKHTKEDLTVYLMTMDLTNINKKFNPITEEDRKIIENMLQEKNKNNKVILMDVTKTYLDYMNKNANRYTHYTPYIFIRILSDKIEGLPDKILYLDTDIVCYKDIKEIYDTDMSNYEIAAALDYLGRKAINENYMNSGVLLMNLKMIKQTGCFDEARELCMTKKMVLPDQTAINKACTKKLLLDDKCNEQYMRNEDTIIRHFSMTFKPLPYPKLINIKPWQIDEIHKVYKIHDFDDIIDEYEKIKAKTLENSEKNNEIEYYSIEREN